MFRKLPDFRSIKYPIHLSNLIITTSTTAIMTVDAGELEQLLKIYYSRLFPYTPYIDWLSYGSREYLGRREFCFTLNGDIYLR